MNKSWCFGSFKEYKNGKKILSDRIQPVVLFYGENGTTINYEN